MKDCGRRTADGRRKKTCGGTGIGRLIGRGFVYL